MRVLAQLQGVQCGWSSGVGAEDRGGLWGVSLQVWVRFWITQGPTGLSEAAGRWAGVWRCSGTEAPGEGWGKAMPGGGVATSELSHGRVVMATGASVPVPPSPWGQL